MKGIRGQMVVNRIQAEGNMQAKILVKEIKSVDKPLSQGAQTENTTTGRHTEDIVQGLQISETPLVHSSPGEEKVILFIVCTSK